MHVCVCVCVCVCVPRNPFQSAPTARFNNPKVRCVCVCVCVICTLRGRSLCSAGQDAPFGSCVCVCVCVSDSPLLSAKWQQNTMQQSITAVGLGMIVFAEN